MNLPIDIVFGWCRGDEEFEMNGYRGASTEDESFGSFLMDQGKELVEEAIDYGMDRIKLELDPKEGESGYKPPEEKPKTEDFLNTTVKLPIVGDVKYWQIGAAVVLMILLRK